MTEPSVARLEYLRKEGAGLEPDVLREAMRVRKEDIVVRTPPKIGSWAQWEGIWQRR